MIAKAKTQGQVKYADKLRDPRWQKVRLKVMERDDWRCLRCRSKTDTLNVHHLQYHGEPWEAPDAELETLCEGCHKWRTDFDQRMRVMPTAQVDAMCTFMEMGGTEQSQMAYIKQCMVAGGEAELELFHAKHDKNWEAAGRAQQRVDAALGQAMRTVLAGMDPFVKADD